MLMVVAALGVTLISFVISHAVPADPIVSNLGQQASQRPEIVAAFKQRWGLDRPLYEQYFAFMGNLVRGDLGTSINTRRPIMADVSQFLPATVELSTVAILFALVVGLRCIEMVRSTTWPDWFLWSESRFRSSGSLRFRSSSSTPRCRLRWDRVGSGHRYSRHHPGPGF